ncbi:hypothetical protein ACFRMQ_37580, partial [Kitasatospora sp. NPDC056783]|uniref:hypothetical protein n=1 Tax=Kitasatospora sp. NPDC056783 TaxID=3345943 RepID=UPI00369D5FD5
FSRNGRFLRTAFQQALRASFFRVSSLPDVFRSVSGVSFIRFPPAGFPANFFQKLIKASGVVSPWDLLRQRMRIS